MEKISTGPSICTCSNTKTQTRRASRFNCEKEEKVEGYRRPRAKRGPPNELKGRKVRIFNEPFGKGADESFSPFIIECDISLLRARKVLFINWTAQLKLTPETFFLLLSISSNRGDALAFLRHGT